MLIVVTPVKRILSPLLRKELPEIPVSTLEVGERIGRGIHGQAYFGILNGKPVCVKGYHQGGEKLWWGRVAAEEEYYRLNKARRELDTLSRNLQEPIGWTSKSNIGPALISTLVRDANGQPSRTLSSVSTVTPSFHAELVALLDDLSRHQKIFNPVPDNVLVQKNELGQENPVLVDFANYENVLQYPYLAVRQLFDASAINQHINKWIARTLRESSQKVHTLFP